MLPSLRDRFLSLSNFEQAWDAVASNRGCAGVDGETITDFGSSKADALSTLRRAIAEDCYRAMPLRQIWIPKRSGGWRELGVPTVRDRLVQQALLQVLYPLMEPQFEPMSFAYRPGRSHRMAVEQVGVWRDRGYTWVLEADIVQYFDRIQHSRLLAELKERVDPPWVVDLVEAWITTGKLTPEGILLPTAGIPQGSPISPMLANVYLDDLDEAMAQPNWKLVRYADDFVVLARSQERLQEAWVALNSLLTAMGLELHPDKTGITTFKQGFRFLGHTFAGDVVVPPTPQRRRIKPESRQGSEMRLIHVDRREAGETVMQQALVEALKAAQQPIPPPLFVVLGYGVRSDSSVKIESPEREWSNGMSSLYVVEQGTCVNKEEGRFRLSPPRGDSLEVPIREVERILIFGQVQVSTAVIGLCLNQQIPVIFLSQTGEYKGHLWSAEFEDLTAERYQFLRQAEDPFQICTARAIVWGKLMNSKQLLLRLNRKRKLEVVAEAIQGIQRDIESLSSVTSLEQLRGYEGITAARYFPALGQLLVNPGFSFRERNRRPPKDPVNSLLSFGYTLLFNNMMSLILAEGLNPYVGNLHGTERKMPALVLDLMEEFRSPIVDSLVVKLINSKTLQPTDFTWPTSEGGVYLAASARRLFIQKFEQAITQSVKHPDLQEAVSYRRAMHLQVQRYKAALLKDIPYEAFLRSV
ncbi:CRISPR-associated endonuclease Cas1 [Leptolyngbya sp. 'hensonii']|uniref:CRISPR-associated endonuclease Cas1 n=1 Tax=Leptolyngbya sp. 'hensonii' TaxID=1922337 RepID=UPI000A5D3DAC|nr:CRISPR-associated endonuclease Cas1 [Leptolyngbya sp. 'hensonii']